MKRPFSFWMLLIALALVLVLTAWMMPAAAFLALPAAPVAGFDPQPGARLPRDARLLASDGSAHDLAEWFDGRHPVLLVPGYHRCPKLCGLVMHELLQRWHEAALPADTARVIALSLDPTDTPASARERGVADLAFARALAADGGTLPVVERLSAPPQGFRAVERIARTAGIVFAPRRRDDETIAHPALLLVVAPDGRIVDYLPALSLDARQLTSALRDARSGRRPTLRESLVLICAHFDPELGRWSPAAMALARAAGLCTLAALTLLAWRPWR